MISPSTFVEPAFARTGYENNFVLLFVREMLKLIKTIPSRCHISFTRVSICLEEESTPHRNLKKCNQKI